MVDFASEPVVAGYDGWAVIDLRSNALVRANNRAQELLELQPDQLPIAFGSLIDSSDLPQLTDDIFPLLRTGEQWQGRLRLGPNRNSVALSPVMLVPQLALDDDMADYASLHFATKQVTDDFVVAADPLTGLPTRSALFGRLESAVERNQTSPHLLAAFFLDMDGLKKINDRYGHEVGDSALVETAQRIASCVPDGALAVRFGGDEFVVIHEALDDIDQGVELANAILRALDEVSNYHAISASIGVAFNRAGEVDAQELIRRADTAMYRAKAQGGSQFAIFDAEMRTEQQADEELRKSVLDAVASNGFGVVAQPVFALATGQVNGVELFIRVRNDTPYLVNANRLFRLAHEYGEALDAAMLDRAMTLAQAWQQSLGRAAPRVQVNVSAQSMATARFAPRVQEALVAHRVPAHAIAFEIEARDIATAGERERSTFAALRELGVPLIIDGFGGSDLTLQEVADWRPAMVKVGVETLSEPVLAGLVRAISSLRIPVCLKGIGAAATLEHAVRIGAFAGQGNALTPVRHIEHVNAELHGKGRLGF